MKDNSAILLSGGLESVALAYMLRPKWAITIDYGQICSGSEIKASRQICKKLDLCHEIIKCDISTLGCGELFKQKKSDLNNSMDWTPFRNQFLLTIGGMKSIQIGVNSLIIGSVKDDNIYLDGRNEFYKSFNKLLSVQEGGLKILTPSLELTSIELIKESKIPYEVLAWSHSCTTNNYSCGSCRSCKKRQYVISKSFNK